MFGSVIDTKKERLWEALITGFEQYSDTLTSRAKLIQTTDALRQQVSRLHFYNVWPSVVWLLVPRCAVTLLRFCGRLRASFPAARKELYLSGYLLLRFLRCYAMLGKHRFYAVTML